MTFIEFISLYASTFGLFLDRRMGVLSSSVFAVAKNNDKSIFTSPRLPSLYVQIRYLRSASAIDSACGNGSCRCTSKLLIWNVQDVHEGVASFAS